MQSKTGLIVSLILGIFIFSAFSFQDSHAARWEWQNPLPTGNSLLDVWRSGDEIFAVGLNGTVLHYTTADGWETMQSHTETDLYGVWGISATNVVAVGRDGTVMRYNGSIWFQQNSNTTQDLHAVWGSEFNNIWAVGDSGRIIHYNGSTWTETIDPSSAFFRGIYGSSNTDVYAVGSGGNIVYWNGSTWAQSGGGVTSEYLYGIWGDATGAEYYAVGANGTVLRYVVGVGWQGSSNTGGTSETLFKVWASGPSDVIAVGTNGIILHYNGAAWNTDTSNTTVNLEGIAGFSASDLIVVGALGKILRYDGSWSFESSYVAENQLSSLWGSDAANVYAVGTVGVILKYDGNAWTAMTSNTTEYLTGVWGSSANNVYAVGWNGTIMHHTEANGWQQEAGGFTMASFRAVWGSSANDVFVVGDTGTILHYDGNAWSFMDDGGISESFYGVWGSGPNDVFAAGTGGVILHYDGGTWSEMSSPVSDNLNAVWGTSSSNVYAVGYNGLMLHYDGHAWTQLESMGFDLYSIWGTSANDIWMVDSVDTYHYDGYVWSKLAKGFSGPYAIWGSSADNIFVTTLLGGVLNLTRTNYYVDINNGSDTNDGTSSGSGAWQTLHHAVNQINLLPVGNYRLNVGNGTYSVTNGEEEALLALDQDNVIVQGSGASILDGEGLGTWVDGFRVDGSEVILRNLIVRNFPGGDGDGSGIHTSSGRSVLVENCEVSGSSQGVVGYGEGMTVVACHIHDNNGEGIRSDSPAFLIQGNRIHDNGGIGIYIYATQADTSGLVTNNLIYQTTATGWGVCVDAFGGFSNSTDIIHNTIHNVDTGVWIYQRSGEFVAPDIKFNIIGSNAATGTGIHHQDLDGGGFSGTIAYNNVWDSATPYDPVDITRSNEISADPLYVGAIDFRLQSGSPCVNAIPTSELDVEKQDLEGNPRPFGSAFDMGAYERTISGTPIFAEKGRSFFNWAVKNGDTYLDFESLAVGERLTDQLSGTYGVEFHSITDPNENPVFHEVIVHATNTPNGRQVIMGTPSPGAGIDGRVEYEISFSTPQKRAGVDRHWLVPGTITRFYNQNDDLIFEYPGGYGHVWEVYFFGYEVDSNETSDWISRIVCSGIIIDTSKQVGNTVALMYGSSTLPAAIAPGDYYVDMVGGDDANDGTSNVTAWQTLHHAFDRINFGNTGTYTLNVEPGVYSIANGEDDARLELFQDSVTVQGDSTSGSQLVGSAGAANWTIGLEIYNDSAVVQMLTVRDFKIGIMARSASPIIRRNSVQNCYGGIYAYSLRADASPDMVNNLVFGLYDETDPDLNSYGLRATAYTGTGFNSTPQILHNTVDALDADVGVFISGANSAPVIQFNTITNFADHGIHNYPDDPGSGTIDYNNLWNNGAGVADNYNGVSEGANDIAANPLYVGGGDYHLQAGSPCADAIPGGVGGIVGDDLEGTTRPQGDGYDMGCYESAGASPTQYSLTVTVVGNGTVSENPGSGIHYEGTQVILVPIPDTGWAFDQWSGDLTGSDDPAIITMDSDKTIVATFVQKSLPDVPTVSSPSHEAIIPYGSTVTLNTSTYYDPDGDGHVRSHWEVWRVDTGEYLSQYPLASVTDLESHTISDALLEGLKYEWQVSYEDADGNLSQSLVYTFKIGTSEPESLPEVIAGEDVGDFGMISIVHWPDDPSPVAVFNIDYDPSNYRIGTYNALTGSYVEFGEGVEMEPGRAYWILARDGLTVNFNGIPVSLAADVYVALDYNENTSNGWNMVAPPNNADYYWGDVQVVVDVAGTLTPMGTLSQLAEDNPYIDRRLWWWANGEYVDDIPENEPVMEAYAGYWVRAKRADVYLRFDPGAQLSALEHQSTMVAHIWHKTKSWLRNLSIFSQEAIADNDSPPMPPAALNDNTVDPVFEGCFIETSEY